MGASWSNGANSRHIHLHSWRNPRIEERHKRIPLRLVLNGLEHSDASQVTLRIANDMLMERQLFYEIVRELQPEQRCIVLRMWTHYMHNEFSRAISLEVRNLFEPNPNGNEESKHPDDTGRVRIYCPGKMSMQPHGVDQLLYRPRHLMDETIHNYAGLESAILESRTQPFPSVLDTSPMEVFEECDPLLEFIVTRADKLNITKDDVQELQAEHQGKRYFQIRQELLEHIRNVFRDTVFEDFRYTRFEEAMLHVDLPTPIREDFYNCYKTKKTLPEMFLLLDVSYIVITPGELKTRHREVRLK